MSDKPQPTTLMPVTFKRALASEDGQSVVFDVLDIENKPARLQVGWQNLSTLAHMLNQAGVDAAEIRKSRGESDEFRGVGLAQIVKGFRIADLPEKKMKVLSLMSPNGLRADFVLQADARDKDGRNIAEALADGLSK